MTQSARTLHPAEAGAAAGAASASSARATSLGTLLGTHVLRDGELVLMILRPSLWFVIFNSFAFAVAVAFVAVVMAVVDHRMHDHFYFETALFFITGRLMFAMLQWMGRLYILTDLRILRISGVFGVDIFDCPLRKVARVRMVSASREKLVGVGSIEIIPTDDDYPAAIWQTISRPREVYQRLQAAINRAKQSGPGCGQI